MFIRLKKTQIKMFTLFGRIFNFIYDHYANLMLGHEPLILVEHFREIKKFNFRKLNSRYRLAFMANCSAMAEFFIKCFLYRTFRLPEEANPFFRIITR